MAITACNEVWTSTPPRHPTQTLSTFISSTTLTAASSAPLRAGVGPLPAPQMRLIPPWGEQKTEPGSSWQRLSHEGIDVRLENLFFSLGLAIARVQAKGEMQRVRKRLFESGNKRDAVGMNLLAWFY